jgi:hypothetical protein
MAFERSDQKFFIGGRSPTFMTNLLLFLLCIGVIVIIMLMLFCPRWGCWRGTKVIGTDGRTYDGGNVIINSACCDGGTPRTPGCPQCTPCDGETCEENCRQYANYPDRYKTCLNECNPPESCEENCQKYGDTTYYDECMRQCKPAQSCEENCRQYANYPDKYKVCLTECNPPQTCEERCKQTSQSTTEYDYCARQCNPPQTCEESCRQKYANSPTAMEQCEQQCNPPQTCQENCRQKYPSTITAASTGYQSCVRQCYPTCAEYCREVFSSDKLAMQSCFDQCNPTQTTTPPDCRDTDGKNINNAGEVHLGDQVYPDSCYDTTHVIEWICRDGKPSELRLTCPGRCLNGACVPVPTTPPSYQTMKILS